MQRLPEQVPQTWLTPDPDSYPVGVTVRLAGAVEVTTKWVPGGRSTGIPPHLRIQVDRLVWQVCDLQAWQTIGDAWFDAHRCLDQYIARQLMNTTAKHRWSITTIDATTIHRTGAAATLTATWTAALTAGRTALLTGELDTLAVSIDGELEALHSPRLEEDGKLDPAGLTAALVEIHQCVTAHELAEQLVAE